VNRSRQGRQNHLTDGSIQLAQHEPFRTAGRPGNRTDLSGMEAVTLDHLTRTGSGQETQCLCIAQSLDPVRVKVTAAPIAALIM
jgi:hypothetical protein